MRVLQCYFTQANCRTCWSGHFLHCLASFIGTFIAALVCCWTDFPVLHLDVDKLGPVYMGKSCPGKKSHPFSRVNFNERLYDKNADPFARASSVHTCSDSFALTESIQLSEPMCLHWEMLARICWTFMKNSSRIMFVSHVNGLSPLLRKWRKTCLAQGTSGK